MNEQHVVAAILTAGLVARNTGEELHPKEVVAVYQLMLAELLNATRPPRAGEETD
jgi:hypothetical protein